MKISRLMLIGVISVELKQKQRLTREEFDRLTGEIRAIIGDRFKNHREGDSERLLLKEFE